MSQTNVKGNGNAGRSAAQSNFLRSLPTNIVIVVVLVIGLLTMLTPFLWMLSASFKQEAKVLSYPPSLWPDPWTLENYQYVFQTLGYMRFVVNSLIVVTFTISGHVISGSPCSSSASQHSSPSMPPPPAGMCSASVMAM